MLLGSLEWSEPDSPVRKHKKSHSQGSSLDFPDNTGWVSCHQTTVCSMSITPLSQAQAQMYSACCIPQWQLINKIIPMKRTYKIHRPQPLYSSTIDNPQGGEGPASPSNIFSFAGESSSSLEPEIAHKYHILGDSEFKERNLERLLQLPKISKSEVTESSVSKCRSNVLSLISQSKRLSLSNSTAQQQRLVSRDHRNIMKHAYYQREWQTRQARRLGKRSTEEYVPIKFEPNASKQEISKNYCREFWERSLRNHDKRLLRHLDDAPFEEQELMSEIQTKKGVTKVERSIPKLSLKRQKDGFYLRGHNKSSRQIETGVEDSLERSYNVEQVLVSNWEKHGVSKLYNI